MTNKIEERWDDVKSIGFPEDIEDDKPLKLIFMMGALSAVMDIGDEFMESRTAKQLGENYLRYQRDVVDVTQALRDEFTGDQQ